MDVVGLQQALTALPSSDGGIEYVKSFGPFGARISALAFTPNTASTSAQEPTQSMGDGVLDGVSESDDDEGSDSDDDGAVKLKSRGRKAPAAMPQYKGSEPTRSSILVKWLPF